MLEKQLLPQAQKTVAFGDWEETIGNSQGNMSRGQDGSWILNYELRAGFTNPYAGISWQFGTLEGQGCLDLENADSLSLEISGTRAHGATIQLVDALPQKATNEPYRILQASLPLSNELKPIVLRFSDFAVPDWWKKAHALPELGSLERHLNRVCRLDVVAGGYVPNGVQDRIIVQSAKVYSVNFWGALLSWIGLLGVVISWFVRESLARQRKRLEREKELARHLPLDIEEIHKRPSNDHWPKIQAWLLQEYENPDCDLQSVSNAIGLSKRQISETLRDNVGLGFREYLNTIRMREAKRLLSETTMQVQSIAFRIGFGTVSHFNRVFKETEGLSPKEWRGRAGIKTD